MARRHVGIAETQSDRCSGAVRGICISLHFTQRQRRFRDPAVAIPDAVVRVLPTLVGQPSIRCLEILDVAVTVAIAVLLHPFEGTVRIREELSQDILSEPPTTELAEQHDEQRRGIGRAVVRAASDQCRFVDTEIPGLVHDSSGLLLGDQIDFLALKFGERLEHTDGQCWIDRQRHVRADQRISTEQRHVPRCAGGDHRLATAARVMQAQRTDVFDRAVKGCAQLAVGGAQLRHRRQPALVAFGRIRQVGVMVPPFDPRGAEGNREIELQHAYPVAFDVDTPHEAVGRDLHGRAIDAELCLAMDVAEPPAEQQAVFFDLE